MTDEQLEALIPDVRYYLECANIGRMFDSIRPVRLIDIMGEFDLTEAEAERLNTLMRAKDDGVPF